MTKTTCPKCGDTIQVSHLSTDGKWPKECTNCGKKFEKPKTTPCLWCGSRYCVAAKCLKVAQTIPFETVEDEYERLREEKHHDN